MECDEGWESFDQQQLDAEYNAAGTVESLEPYFERYAHESERVRAACECRLGLAYGDGDRRRLDVFPAGPQRAPVLVYLHGGYWRRMSKDDFSFFAEPFVREAAVVVPSYSLAPSAALDEIVAEMRDVVLWVVRNIAAHNGDPQRIVVCGHSAGGQLGGMLAGTDWKSQGLERHPIVGLCGISGLYDLAPVRRSNVNEWLRLDDEEARRNSPILHLPRVPIPLVATVGERETSEFQRQTLDFALAWRECGYPAECAVMTGLNHYDMPLDVLNEHSRLRASVLRLLQGVPI